MDPGCILGVSLIRPEEPEIPISNFWMEEMGFGDHHGNFLGTVRQPAKVKTFVSHAFEYFSPFGRFE
jgi:hypothetical protein